MLENNVSTQFLCIIIILCMQFYTSITHFISKGFIVTNHLKHFPSADDLRKLTVDSRKKILQEIGNSKKYVRKMTRPKTRLLFNLQLETVVGLRVKSFHLLQ